MKRLLFLIAMSVIGISFAQAQEIKGRVTDSRDGTPLSNVSIILKEQTPELQQMRMGDLLSGLQQVPHLFFPVLVLLNRK